MRTQTGCVAHGRYYLPGQLNDVGVPPHAVPRFGGRCPLFSRSDWCSCRSFFHVAIHYIVALHNSMCYAAHQVARRPPTFLELLRAKHLRASRHLELCLCGFASVSPRSCEPLLKMQWPSVKPCQKKTLLNQNQLPDPFRLRKGKAHLSLACRGCLDGCCFRSRTSNVCLCSFDAAVKAAFSVSVFASRRCLENRVPERWANWNY